MTNQAAIQILTLISQNEIGESLHEALILAIEALQKQEPVQIRKFGDGTSKCPICRNWLKDGDEYCNLCGQAVKMEDEDEHNIESD